MATHNAIAAAPYSEIQTQEPAHRLKNDGERVLLMIVEHFIVEMGGYFTIIYYMIRGI